MRCNFGDALSLVRQTYLYITLHRLAAVVVDFRNCLLHIVTNNAAVLKPLQSQ